MTYSIVARDPETGEMGVAVETALPGVGRLCPWAEAGVGAVATQALVRVAHGPAGLNLMKNGFTASEALDALLSGDTGRDVRQLAMVDALGNVSAHTGINTIRYAGHRVGTQFSVQANMMARETVPAVMANAYTEAAGQPLVMRMLAALEAAQAEGGDFRGQQSAALKIVSGEAHKNSWQGVIYDVRVDDHPTPLSELRRIVQRQMAYNIADDASVLARSGDFDGAMKRIQEAVELDGLDPQIRFWFALDVADQGRIDLVEGMLRDLLADPKWLECAERYGETRTFQTEGLIQRLKALNL